VTGVGRFPRDVLADGVRPGRWLATCAGRAHCSERRHSEATHLQQATHLQVEPHPQVETHLQVEPHPQVETHPRVEMKKPCRQRIRVSRCHAGKPPCSDDGSPGCIKEETSNRGLGFRLKHEIERGPGGLPEFREAGVDNYLTNSLRPRLRAKRISTPLCLCVRHTEEC